MLGLMVPSGIAPEVVPALQDDALPGLKLRDQVGPTPQGFLFVPVDAHFLEIVRGPEMDLVVAGAGVKGDEVWGGIGRLDEEVCGVEDLHLGDLLAEPRHRQMALEFGREISPLRFVVPLDILRGDGGASLPLVLGMKRGLQPLVGQVPFGEEPGDDRVVLIPHEQEHVEVVLQKRDSKGLDGVEVIPSPAVYGDGQFADRDWGTTGCRRRGCTGCRGGDASNGGQAHSDARGLGQKLAAGLPTVVVRHAILLTRLHPCEYRSVRRQKIYARLLHCWVLYLHVRSALRPTAALVDSPGPKLGTRDATEKAGLRDACRSGRGLWACQQLGPHQEAGSRRKASQGNGLERRS